MSKRLGAAFIGALGSVALLAASCSQPAPTSNPLTSSAAPNPSPTAFVEPGGPVPSSLLGDWFLPTAGVNAAIGCRTPLSAQTCNLRFTLMATTYSFAGTAPPGPGDVVVNNSEIDFFNVAQCDLQGAAGVGRYTWTLAGTALHLSPLNNDPCGRSAYLTNQSFYRSL